MYGIYTDHELEMKNYYLIGKSPLARMAVPI